MAKILLLYISILLILLKLTYSLNEGESDLINNLPGLTVKQSFKQYSGYLDVADNNHFFYWFVESSAKPATDPLLLFLTGGPGCSSLLALFQENGPLRVSPDEATVSYDNYSWNTIANVLYLESPIGTGFSYRDNISSADIKASDNETAHYNYLAVQKFFDKFPQFRKNDFYITGESYGGVYVPTLAVEILRDTNSSINLKGIAIGNGFFNAKKISENRIFYAYYHGLIDTQTWTELTEVCCKSCLKDPLVCEFPIITPNYTFVAVNNNTRCSQLVTLFYLQFLSSGIETYNIYNFCPKFDPKNVSSIQTHECVSDSFIKYLRKKEVLSAIHVRTTPLSQNYSDCNDNLLARYRMDYTGMEGVVDSLINKYKLNNTVIFNGDIDLACDVIGAQSFIDELKLPVETSYTHWTHDGQTAGFVKRYKALTYATVRGAGHMAPKDKPGPVLKIIEELIGKSHLN